MSQPRIIPILLVRKGMLHKGEGFDNYKYIGDPLNAVKVFNELEVDELIVLDISAGTENRAIDAELVQRIAAEAFMPVAVGGGISSVSQARTLLAAGTEKVIVNSAAVREPSLITELANEFGSQSIVCCIDTKRSFFSNHARVRINCGSKKTNWEPLAWARMAESLGAGELMLNSIDNDGKQTGYDLETVEEVSANVSVPVIAAGGAANFTHMVEVIEKGAAAAAAGSMFVFHGKRRAVLISYVDRHLIDAKFPFTFNFR